MDLNWIAIGATLFAGLSTGLGALPIYFKKEIDKNLLELGMGFSAGIMLVASFVSLIMPGLEEAKNIFNAHGALLVVLAGILMGYLMIIFIHDYLPHEHIFKKSDMGHQNRYSKKILIVLAIALHNFPEGLAVGVGFGTGDDSGGLALALAISMQNMPEGLVVALALLSEGASKNKAFLMALCSGLVEPFAALIGFLTTQSSALALPMALGFAGGAMLFVICQEMFPELFRQGHERRATIGVIVGIMAMLSLDFLIA